MSRPNDALASIIHEAGMSLAGLASRVNTLGRSLGLNLTYDYTAVHRWTRKGERPRRREVRELIAHALAERLGRPVSLADIGMASVEPDQIDLGLIYSDDVDVALSGTAQLLQADLDNASITVLPPSPSAWTDASLSWLVRFGPNRLPQHTSPVRVGAADIEVVRATVEAFTNLDNQFGGGHARRALVQYLHTDVAGLLTGRYNEQTGRELFSVAAQATLLAAWASYDAGKHGLSQRYFVQALRLAQAADNVLLGGSVLDAMSHQATFMGRHREATNLARAARSGTLGHATATLTAHFHVMEARALAAGGDAAGSEQALGEAVRIFECRRPGDDPDWIAYFDDSELSAEISHCFRDLGRVADAVTYAQHSLCAGTNASARSEFFVTMVLAEGRLGRGDVDEACHTVRHALASGRRLRSARCAEYVRRFRRGIKRHAGVAAVQELNEYAEEHPLWHTTAA